MSKPLLNHQYNSNSKSIDTILMKLMVDAEVAFLFNVNVTWLQVYQPLVSNSLTQGCHSEQIFIQKCLGKNIFHFKLD